MKRTLTLFILAFAGLSFSSCYKVWTCECTYNDTGSGLNSSGTSSTQSPGFKKKLKEKCEAQNYNETVGGITRMQTCERR